MLFWKVNNLNPAQGFEHVKGYVGLAAGKPRGCSEQVLCLFCCSRVLWQYYNPEKLPNHDDGGSTVYTGKLMENYRDIIS